MRSRVERASSLIELLNAGLIQRKPVFLKYRWPDGADAPRTFTFSGQSGSNGGTVNFGSRFAQAEISLTNGKPDWTID